jgi:hypothetical protein
LAFNLPEKGPYTTTKPHNYADFFVSSKTEDQARSGEDACPNHFIDDQRGDIEHVQIPLLQARMLSPNTCTIVFLVIV